MRANGDTLWHQLYNSPVLTYLLKIPILRPFYAKEKESVKSTVTYTGKINQEMPTFPNAKVQSFPEKIQDTSILP